ncbi:MAG: DUF445 domain-containing protein [Desulfobacterales bacterium]|nr:DUF445 domain-containing protein [Desulfobacterales bacterium]
MWDSMVVFFSNKAVIAYIAIPFINALVGWGTNYLAFLMIFWPVEFVGYRPLYLGWQGIVPMRIHIMAALACDLITTKLLSIQEVFSQVDPVEVAKELEETIDSLTPKLTHEIMTETAPIMWESLPLFAKNQIYSMIRKDSPNVIKLITDDLKKNITRIFDLKKVVVDTLVRNKAVMNKIIIECAKPEFDFLVRSGLYLGFLCGVVQMCIWFFFKRWWLLPLGGALVGYITNWIALKLVFEPMEPKKVGPFTLHGLFLRRQKEVSEAYAQQVQTGILNPTNILEGILRSPSSDELFRIIQFHISHYIDKSAGLAKPFVQFAIGTKDFIEMKNTVCDRLLEELPKHAHVLEDYTLKTLDIENLIKTKMSALPPADFVGVIRPAFEQDEWMLIAGGAVLGLIVGFMQLFLLQ